MKGIRSWSRKIGHQKKVYTVEVIIKPFFFHVINIWIAK